MKPPRLYASARVAFVAISLIFFGFPFYWAALLALSDPANGRLPAWSNFYPHELSWQSFDALTNSFVEDSIVNSLIVAASTAVASTVLAVGAGYALARVRFGRGLLLVTMLVLRVLPPVALMIPAFILAVRFDLRDSLVGLVLIYTALSLPFSMWLIYVGIRALPPELEEAALIDGCTRRQAVGLLARLALPSILAAGTFAFVFAWTEFAIALILNQNNGVTFPVTLSFPDAPSQDPYVAALVLAGAVPGLILALLIQRWLSRGPLVDALDG